MLIFVSVDLWGHDDYSVDVGDTKVTPPISSSEIKVAPDDGADNTNKKAELIGGKNWRPSSFVSRGLYLQICQSCLFH